ncbi:Hypothetical protein NTJ_00345 [Nesidiocoris tenuis]|uniref:Uncharacterized protein n=1 Tax=Nesidiocoris tenuis TaxID=355587 RepID=A0ABN7A8R3_9HEMI|nr:Hypothetical protein NTJ_00345 [Nesidiocoris tenuis]
MAHSRWITTANRILRLYVSTKEPTPNLRLLVEFIMKVYVPSWFNIKVYPSSTNGALHLFEMIKRSSFLPQKHREVVHGVLQRNAFFAHPENIILAMLHDRKKEIRQMGVKKILEARTAVQKEEIRKFENPRLNFMASDYVNMIAWTEVLEPQSTIHFSESELTDIADSGRKLSIFDVPCHSQAVERNVRLVTEASSSVFGPKARDGFIRNRIRSRKDMPKFETKRDFFIEEVQPQDETPLH